MRVLILLVILVEWAVAHSMTQSAATSIIDQHDIKALEIYNQLKNKYTKNTDPLIIAWGDRLELHHDKKISTYSIISSQYQELKSVAHVILSVFSLFDPLNNFPQNKTSVKDYRSLVATLLHAIDSLNLSASQKERQRKILAMTNALLDSAIEQNKCSVQMLNNYFHSIQPLIMHNVKEAVAAQIKVVNQQMTLIEQQLTAKELNHLFVIIPVGKTPRNENLMGQYFSKYLNAPMDSQRLIYAEGLQDSTNILGLVGTWQIESQLSELFFHDPDRMKKDLLSNDAHSYLAGCSKGANKEEALVCK